MLLNRRSLIRLAAAPVGWLRLPASTPLPDDPGALIRAPADPAEWAEFRNSLHAWRKQAKARLNYDGSLYRREDFAWVASSFACCFLMMCDESFYDHAGDVYRVEGFLSDAAADFGGVDSLVLWHAYPRVGLDERNQFDMYRDMPGGLGGLRQVARRCQSRGVKVYIDYNPWDTGTRREGVPDLEALAGLVEAVGADGIFLDTMRQGAREFRARLDAVRRGVALEPEGVAPLDSIADHHLSWAQELVDSHVPGVLRNKWLERGHMQHSIRRWSRDHTGEMHIAWMNGSGLMVWENVFGAWVGWSARDRSLLRSMLPIQRRYAALFASEKWTPLVPALPRNVFASLWGERGLRLWTLVNRAESVVEGPLLSVDAHPGDRFYDLVAGRQLQAVSRGGRLELSGAMAPRGIGAVLAVEDGRQGEGFARFLDSQRKTASGALWDTRFPARRTTLRPVESSRRHGRVPEGMVAIPPDNPVLGVTFRTRECGFYESQTDLRLSNRGTAVFERTVRLNAYAIDLTPVTNAEYAAFLGAAGWKPRHPHNFLKHWRDGRPPAGKLDHPVVYVDLDDARAYARWAGKRLPTEEEWQYAAQGRERRKYPWGDKFEPGRANAGETRDTTRVKAFPQGRSPFGCFDMCGNTWEWTESERSDGRTRFAVIRGGSWYKAEGSWWYMDGGPQPADFGVKFLLMWSGLDRCSTIGFRCVVDITA